MGLQRRPGHAGTQHPPVSAGVSGSGWTSATFGEVCACDLPAAVGRSQWTVSHHLTLLVAAGVLHREQPGKWAWFRVRRAMLDDLASSLATVTNVC